MKIAHRVGITSTIIVFLGMPVSTSVLKAQNLSGELPKETQSSDAYSTNKQEQPTSNENNSATENTERVPTSNAPSTDTDSETLTPSPITSPIERVPVSSQSPCPNSGEIKK
ncbi:MAG: hypothetical protein N5P05_002755 [Chroococcopsis gigantea SAG 12.99]|jgi:cytoskeletal protein RodZ|nr:hypothetical protein [Chroococcopsis gigantea SAG 12.99]